VVGCVFKIEMTKPPNKDIYTSILNNNVIVKKNKQKFSSVDFASCKCFVKPKVNPPTIELQSV
jgi:hypothetical protein